MKNKIFLQYEDLKIRSLNFLAKTNGGKPWEFKFSEKNPTTLIASSLAVMLLGLLDSIKSLKSKEKENWAAYLNSFQREDGFFSDEDIEEKNLMPGYTKERALFHRTRHVLFALTTLGYKPKYRFHFLENFLTPSLVKQWMKIQDLTNYWDVSNKMMDLCLFLDYEANINKKADRAIDIILECCDDNTHPETGYHDQGKSDLRNAMAGAMHLYPIYFLKGRRPHYPEKVIQTTLSLQQKDGLFGYETQKGGEDCLDYDAVNILVNFSFLTPFMGEELKQSLKKLLKALEELVNEDGGFSCHLRQESYRFGTFTTEVYSGKSSLWSTYARLLTIAMAMKVLNPLEGRKWKLGNNIMEIWNAQKNCLKGGFI